jgi:hypothetical protein
MRVGQGGSAEGWFIKAQSPTVSAAMSSGMAMLMVRLMG